MLLDEAVDTFRRKIALQTPVCDNCDRASVILIDGYPEKIVDGPGEAPKSSTLCSVLCDRCALIVAQRILTNLRKLEEAIR